MPFSSESGKAAQAKRKTHGTGAYLKHLKENDPKTYAEIQRKQVEKYGGIEGYKKEMLRRVNLRWSKKNEGTT